MTTNSHGSSHLTEAVWRYGGVNADHPSSCPGSWSTPHEQVLGDQHVHRPRQQKPRRPCVLALPDHRPACRHPPFHGRVGERHERAGRHPLEERQLCEAEPAGQRGHRGLLLRDGRPDIVTASAATTVFVARWPLSRSCCWARAWSGTGSPSPSTPARRWRCWPTLPSSTDRVRATLWPSCCGLGTTPNTPVAPCGARCRRCARRSERTPRARAFAPLDGGGSPHRGPADVLDAGTGEFTPLPRSRGHRPSTWRDPASMRRWSHR
jgi:hypothetical protein